MKNRKSTKTDASDMRPSQWPVGVVGQGLMGRSIVTCLLAAGHRVHGVTSTPARLKTAARQVLASLRELKKEGLLGRARPEAALKRFSISCDYADLDGCRLVVESVREDLDVKKEVIRRVEDAVGAGTIIGSNTSAIPITHLQKGARRPERILGIHWAEPAHITRFLEVICGDRTRLAHARKVMALAQRWGKEPSLLRKDIRGFITNRIMYAMIREAFHLVDSGVCSMEDVDRSVRNDMGWWITLAGVFRWMDLTGIHSYAAVMKDLNPELCNTAEVSPLMRKVAGSGARGIANGKGFYKYTKASAARWEKAFIRFSYDIRKLALKYPQDVGDRGP